ncbi:alpha-amylase [Flaviaesturariibacter flavus]|uniref:Alpha-amylase n=1 Tax=Flaviaesturariibacter flavus TaxID=2502780 RepID=A0A4R1BNP1_9BACT|nr:glycoside hydrolase family 13 protein [Flaviaesturariibacter flavus]TCJ19169.1 alpha-amylase [Flaviaesturariibacter flavus]
MNKHFLLGVTLLLISSVSFAQPLQPQGVYPTNWWVGMKNPKLQLMIHAPGAGNYTYSISDPRVQVQKVTPAENKNYAFIDLVVKAGAKPGVVKINWKKGGDQGSFDYELKARRAGNGTAFAQGVRSEDFIYFLMPDRFANGDYSNDRIGRYRDQSLNRDSMYHRHGGDIEGVINHLDYIQDLGATTVWLTPVLENDMPNRTEHGYAITNHYQVDERYGGNLAYKRLSDALHKRGMKLIQDAVPNHSGLWNFFVQDMPMKDWLHQWPSFQQTSYKDQTLMDPYAAPKEKRIMEKGWFTQQMPDMNEDNPYVANFLTQHAIWSVEEFGVDGWRVDTYIYNDLNFMNRWNAALYAEYPRITIFGETWVHGVANQAYFVKNNISNIPVKSNLTGATDFQAKFYGIDPALTQNFGWTEGVNRLYSTLANDFLYQDATNNVVFLDNHDMTRFLSTVNEDVDKLKVGIGWLLTTRGIPQLYYGTEVLLKGVSNPDGLVRGDFPGGWKEDKQNKFTAAGRTGREGEVHDWVKTIASYRKGSTALKTGKLMQYLPKDWVYTYFRYDSKSTVMMVMNTSPDERTVDPQYFTERVKGFSHAKNIMGSTTMSLTDKWKVPGKSIWILELQ